MHGSIFMALKRHVDAAHGPGAWDALRAEAKVPGRLYTSLGDYPDEEVMALVQAAVRVTGQDSATVLVGFGRFLARDLVATYGSLLDASWTAFDVLERTEDTIHTVVRARHPSARPPVLTATRRGPEHVAIHYASARRLCPLARGIVLGVGDHFGTPLEVSEPTCQRKGAAACVLEVLPVWRPPAPRGEAAERASLR